MTEPLLSADASLAAQATIAVKASVLNAIAILEWTTSASIDFFPPCLECEYWDFLPGVVMQRNAGQAFS
jgi:hypothetical protein